MFWFKGGKVTHKGGENFHYVVACGRFMYLSNDIRFVVVVTVVSYFGSSIVGELVGVIIVLMLFVLFIISCCYYSFVYYR